MTLRTCSLAHHCAQTVVLSALLLLPFRTLAQAEAVKMTSASAGGVSATQLQTTTATVTEVDQKARMVSVKTESGEEMSLAVSEEVKRLGEVKVGDLLSIGYMESIGLEFREPTAEELKDPYKVTEITERAGAMEAPAGGEARMLRAVVTVEGASRWLNTLTVKGPKGNYLVLEVKPGMVEWEKVRIGRQMVGTYTEAVVMSLEPAPKK